MKLRSFVLFVFVAARLSIASTEQRPAIFPFEPAQMLTVLPAAPTDWIILRSEADSNLGEWVETRAMRVFQAPPAPAAATASPASLAPAAPGRAVALEAAPGKIEISVVDTAGFAPALAAFADFAPAKNGNLEKKLIGGVPAIVIGNENERQFVQLLVSSRYLIEITLTHLPRQRVEDWLRAFHFDNLPSANRTRASGAREFRVMHLDELQPKNNRSYLVSTTDTKRVDAFLKTLPATAEEPAAPKEGPAVAR